MSKTLIVYSHPHKKGHNGLILKCVEEELKKRGEKYEEIDLYHCSFDPRMKPSEHFLAKNFKMGEDALALQKKVAESEHMIFIYPIWWNSAPAMMKGFFDRVFSAKFAFKYVKVIGSLGRPIGLLKGKKAAVFITTGSPKILHWLIEGNRSKKVVSWDTLNFCGVKNKVFHYGFANELGERAKKKIPRMVKRGLNWLYR